MAAFAGLVGNAAAVAEAKRISFTETRCLIIVGPALCGKTLMLDCIRASQRECHFADFSKQDCPKRIMDAVASVRSVTPSDRVVVAVVDDADTVFTDRSHWTALAACLNRLPGKTAFLMASAVGPPRMASLKANVLRLSTVPVQTLSRWGRDRLSENPSEEDVALVARAARASRGVPGRMLLALRDPIFLEAVDKFETSRYNVAQRVYTRPLNYADVEDHVASDGGSMLFEVLWQNCALTLPRQKAAALERARKALAGSMDGLVLEKHGHAFRGRHEIVGQALSCCQFAESAKHVPIDALVYTNAVSQGGVRSTARRALLESALAEGMSLAEWRQKKATNGSKASGSVS